jgi:hypothetical protein
MEGDQRSPQDVSENIPEGVMATQGTANRGSGGGSTALEDPSGSGVRRDPTNRTEHLNAQDGVLMNNRGNGERLSQQDGLLQERAEQQNQHDVGPSWSLPDSVERRIQEAKEQTGGSGGAPNVDVRVDATVETNPEQLRQDILSEVEAQMLPEIEDLRSQLGGGTTPIGGGPL